jgi:hypothetical protein
MRLQEQDDTHLQYAFSLGKSLPLRLSSQGRKIREGKFRGIHLEFDYFNRAALLR